MHQHCNHFWLIESPDGETSVGRCKHCGEIKEFINSLPIDRTPKGTVAMSRNQRGQDTIPGHRSEKLTKRRRVRSDLNESGSSFDDAVKIVEGG